MIGLRLRDQLDVRQLRLTSVKDWSDSKQAFYQQFRDWLVESGYSTSALFLYGLAMRLAFTRLQ